MVCFGVLLVAAGCSPDSFLVPFAGTGGQQVMVEGSVDLVEARLQDALSDAGATALPKRKGQDLCLIGMTRSRKVFTLVLSREKAEGSDKTRVRVQWDREADEEFWRKVVQPLAAPAHPANGSE
jgi:hypothetical protein